MRTHSSTRVARRETSSSPFREKSPAFEPPSSWISLQQEGESRRFAFHGTRKRAPRRCPCGRMGAATRGGPGSLSSRDCAARRPLAIAGHPDFGAASGVNRPGARPIAFTFTNFEGNMSPWERQHSSARSSSSASVATHDRPSTGTVDELLSADRKYTSEGSLESTGSNVLVSRPSKGGKQATFSTIPLGCSVRWGVLGGACFCQERPIVVGLRGRIRTA